MNDHKIIEYKKSASTSIADESDPSRNAAHSLRSNKKKITVEHCTRALTFGSLQPASLTLYQEPRRFGQKSGKNSVYDDASIGKSNAKLSRLFV